MFSRADRADRPASTGVTEATCSSALFGDLFDFESLESGQGLTVLDLGPVSSSTVAFLGQFKCRLHVLDLLSEPSLNEQQDLSGEELLSVLEQLIEFPAGTRFDICLFWDLFNYLNRSTISALNTLLAPYLKPTSKAHCFGLLKANTPLTYQRYGIVNADLLSVSPLNDPAPQIYPHPQATLKSLLSSFSINRTMLLGEGRLEMLLHSCVNNPGPDECSLR